MNMVIYLSRLPPIHPTTEPIRVTLGYTYTYTTLFFIASSSSLRMFGAQYMFAFTWCGSIIEKSTGLFLGSGRMGNGGGDRCSGVMTLTTLLDQIACHPFCFFFVFFSLVSIISRVLGTGSRGKEVQYSWKAFLVQPVFVLSFARDIGQGKGVLSGQCCI